MQGKVGARDGCVIGKAAIDDHQSGPKSQLFPTSQALREAGLDRWENC